ncbi:MAG: phosphatidate cytidylyltransferase [Spirochaetaceae bacterium]|jgi:dolichol kinase|nr:phosphatidate cytidylyltransferase [Spirochaetaceae bacterium]
MAFFKIRVPESLKTEFTRKAIHLLIGVSPTLAAFDRTFTIILLFSGTALYIVLEVLRFSGRTVPLFSAVSARASRERDKGRFILGPVTLGLGAAGALLFYTPLAAALGIYAVAFGDSAASLAGYFGRLRPRFLRGKSLEGTLACFLAVLLIGYRLSPHAALPAALAAACVEALPLKDFDNIAIPLATGLFSLFPLNFFP